MTIRTKDRDNADLDIASNTVGAQEVPLNQIANAAGALIDPATDAMLAAISAKLPALVERTGIDPAAIDQVIGGCVSQVGEQAFNITRTAWLAAGLA